MSGYKWWHLPHPGRQAARIARCSKTTLYQEKCRSVYRNGCNANMAQLARGECGGCDKTFEACDPLEKFRRWAEDHARTAVRRERRRR